MAKQTLSFSADTEADRDILEWLNEQRNRSEAIRNVVRDAIAPPREPSCPTWDIGAIRQVFEAVLDERLAGLALASATGDEDKPRGENPELAARLDSLEF